MKIIERRTCFEIEDDGEIVKRFQFDENPGRRAISGIVKKKRALQEAKTFAGKGHTFEKLD